MTPNTAQFYLTTENRTAVERRTTPSSPDWLKGYYFVRFAVSAAWVALALTVATRAPALAAVMLVAYPAWDAFANFVDMSRSGGLAANRSQLLNVIVSTATVAPYAAFGAFYFLVSAIWLTVSGARSRRAAR